MPKVVWFFRKQRPNGNFSIEGSFREILPHFEEEPWELEWREASRYSNGVLSRLKIAWEISRIQADAIHITGDIHFAAIFARSPIVILTIHDLGFLKENKGFKRWILQLLWLKWPVRRCAKVVAVSEATRRDIIAQGCIPIERTEVIPSVISSHFTQRDKLPENSPPVVLHVGLARNKNLMGHVRALQGLDIKLRIVGNLSKSDERLLRAHSILFESMSNLSAGEMQWAYATADVLLFCSTHEGLGLPLLEARAVGLPAVTSSIEPMKTLAEGWALTANPHDSSDIRCQVIKALASVSGAHHEGRISSENHVQWTSEVALAYKKVYMGCLESNSTCS